MNIENTSGHLWSGRSQPDEKHDDPQFQLLLAKRWNEFVSCDRRASSMRPFFEQYVFEPDTSAVVDLAAGIGCEASWMAARIPNFVANEVDDTFFDTLAALRARIACDFQISKYN